MIRGFEPSRALEVIHPKYGSGYRIGGRLVLTAAHILDEVSSVCRVRSKQSFGEAEATVLYKTSKVDIALIQLPDSIEPCKSIVFGLLPEAKGGEKLDFQMYGYPKWGRTQRDQGTAAGGRQVEGIIYLSDTSPDGLLVLEALRSPEGSLDSGSDWEGNSGAAIICDGLIVGVLRQHQNPKRPASLEASPLYEVYSDKQWCCLLKEHDINPKPEIVRIQDQTAHNNLAKLRSEYNSDLEGEKPQKTKEKRIINFGSLISVPTWEGRSQLVEALKMKLQPENPLRVLVISGQGGIGKTSLAIKLIESLGIDIEPPSVITDACLYDGIIYIEINTDTKFDDLIGHLSKGLEIRIRAAFDNKSGDSRKVPDARESIQRVIEGLSKSRFLVVIDDLQKILYSACQVEGRRSQVGVAIEDNVSKLLNALVYQNHCSKIIITSRNIPKDLSDARCKGLDFDPVLVHLETLDGVDDDSGVKILRQKNLQDSEEDLYWITRRVGGHVFLLAQLASIGKGKPGFLRKHPEWVTRKAKPILQEQLASQREESQNLLIHMSILREAIDIQGLTFLRLYSTELDNKGRLEESSNLGKDADFTDNEVEATEVVIEELIDSSLVQVSYSQAQCEPLYGLQAIVAEYLQDEYKSEINKLYEAAFRYYQTQHYSCSLTSDIEAEYFAFQLQYYSESFKLLYRSLDDYLLSWGHWRFLLSRYESCLPHLKECQRADCLKELANIYRNNLNKWDEAEKLLQESLSISREQNSSSKVANALAELGRIMNNRGDWNNAKKLYSEALQIYQELNDSFDIALAQDALGDVEFNIGNLDEAEKSYNQALQLFEEIGSKRSFIARACTLVSLGGLEQRRGNWNTARNYYQRSLEIRQSINDIWRIPGNWMSLGGIEQNFGNWSKAEQCYQTALELSKNLAEYTDIANCYISLGSIKECYGDWNAAQVLYEKALEIREDLNERSSLAYSWINLGSIKQRLGDWEEAKSCYEKALELSTEVNDSYGLASAYSCLGGVEKSIGNWDKARELLNKCLDILTKLGDSNNSSVTLAQLGEIECAQGNYEKAEHIYQQFLDCMNTQGDRRKLVEGWGVWGDLKVKQEQWDQAEDLYQKALVLAQELGDSLNVANLNHGLGKVNLGKGYLDLAAQFLNKSLEQANQLKIPELIAEANYSFAQLWSKRGNLNAAQQSYDIAHQIFSQLGALSNLENIEREWTKME
jgi:tetratricopeptide (TPR) repeat protein